MSVPQIWLVTGASSGFGRAIAEAAIAAGDTVVAVARRTTALADLVAAAIRTALAADKTPLRLPLGSDAVDAISDTWIRSVSSPRRHPANRSASPTASSSPGGRRNNGGELDHYAATAVDVVRSAPRPATSRITR